MCIKSSEVLIDLLYYSIDLEKELLQTSTFINTISSVKLRFHFEVSEMVSSESHSLVHS